MKEKNEYRTGRHSLFKLYTHLVFTPKYQRKIFTHDMLVRLETIMREKCVDMEAELITFNGEADHVHLLVSFPAKVSISELVRLLKGVSSRLIRKEFWPEIKNHLWGNHFWSPSYCAITSGGAPLEIIKKYIEHQNRPSTDNQKKMSAVAKKRWEKKK